MSSFIYLIYSICGIDASFERISYRELVRLSIGALFRKSGEISCTYSWHPKNVERTLNLK